MATTNHEIMEMLDAFDLTHRYRAPAEFTGNDHKTVAKLRPATRLPPLEMLAEERQHLDTLPTEPHERFAGLTRPFPPRKRR